MYFYQNISKLCQVKKKQNAENVQYDAVCVRKAEACVFVCMHKVPFFEENRKCIALVPNRWNLNA